MTREEYVERMEKEDDWAPGWDAIDREFDRLYPGQEPAHYATNIQARAIFGGDNYLDGYSIYESQKGYQHIVTYGMSELYADEEAFGGEYSRWGYEMTIKLRENSAEDCLWALDMLSNLARYTYTTESFFEAGECVPGNGTSLHIGTESLITALLIVNDTSAQTLDTLHGKVEFIQLVGITESELDAIREDGSNISILIEKMKKDNPELITDMKRKKSYL